jgi:putative transcriptional regulator
MAVPSAVREVLARRIAGDIILSTNPGATMKKWRELFGTSKAKLAEGMKISPSVISDYESGRRRSPGSTFVRRFVENLIVIDESEGGHFVRELSKLSSTPSDAILDIREFPVPVSGSRIQEAVAGTVIACSDLISRNLCGYTIVDSLRAITTLSGHDFTQIFGSTTERVLVFTNVSHGRSPMVAIRVHSLKPRMVVIHGLKEVDKLAIKLAEYEQIPLVVSNLDTAEELQSSLANLYAQISRSTLLEMAKDKE